jgi:hypothetical protein
MPLGNLRALANSVTSVVNPNTPATLFISTGNTTVNYRQIPSYDQAAVSAQVQPLSTGDLKQLEGLNVQGAEKAIYLNGEALAINRIKKLGGDLVVFSPANAPPEGTTWLIKANLEQWSSTWCKVAVSLQDDDLSGQIA